LHNFLALLVQGRSCLVENQYARIFDEGTSDSNSLLLASREFPSFESTFLHKTFVEGKDAIRATHLVNRHVLQFVKSLVHLIHSVSCKLVADVGSKVLKAVLTLLIPLLYSSQVKCAVKVLKLIDSSADDTLDITRQGLTSQDCLQLISPFKADYNIFPPSTVLVRNFVDGFKEIVRVFFSFFKELIVNSCH